MHAESGTDLDLLVRASLMACARQKKQRAFDAIGHCARLRRAVSDIRSEHRVAIAKWRARSDALTACAHGAVSLCKDVEAVLRSLASRPRSGAVIDHLLRETSRTRWEKLHARRRLTVVQAAADTTERELCTAKERCGVLERQVRVAKKRAACLCSVISLVQASNRAVVAALQEQSLVLNRCLSDFGERDACQKV